MKCAWKEFLSILPQWMRQEVDRMGQTGLQELRLRINAPPELVLGNRSMWLNRPVSGEDLQFSVNAASKYSPWAAQTIADGYLTAPGGHRIGLCGEVVIQNGQVGVLRKLQSICIRVARDFPGLGREVRVSDSLLILGAPGWGKTTLLRDICRNLAEKETVCVVDERGELFPQGFDRGSRLDVLTGYPKARGVDRVMRTMGPSWIAVDEITAQEDCDALIQAVGCGVKLLATAHAASRQDLSRRPVYKKLLQMALFPQVLILNRERQWHMERMNECI